MADIALTAAQVAAIFPDDADIKDFIAGEAVTQGEALYLASTGKVLGSNAGAAATAVFLGIALRAAGAGQAVSVLREGHLYGYTVAALAYGAPVYLSNTAGVLSTTVGTVTVNVGRVMPMPDSSLTKVLYVAAKWETVWS